MGFYGSLVLEQGSYNTFMKESDEAGYAENTIQPIYPFTGVFGIVAYDVTPDQTAQLQFSYTAKS